MPIDKCESLSLCPKKVGGGSEHDLDILTTKIIAYKILGQLDLNEMQMVYDCYVQVVESN